MTSSPLYNIVKGTPVGSDCHVRQLFRPAGAPFVGRRAVTTVAFAHQSGAPHVIPGIEMVRGVQLPWLSLTPGVEKPEQAAPGWTEQDATAIQEYWLSRGVSNPLHLERHLSLSRKNPRLRSVPYLEDRMALWEQALAAYPDIDINRVVREDEFAIERLPGPWVDRLQLLKRKHPEVYWEKVLEECPAFGFAPLGRMAAALSIWAYFHVGPDSPFL